MLRGSSAGGALHCLVSSSPVTRLRVEVLHRVQKGCGVDESLRQYEVARASEEGRDVRVSEEWRDAGAWGLEGLAEAQPEIFGETLLSALGAALTENPVLLRGDAPLASRAAHALRGALLPFPWRHAFLPPPLPGFEDAPGPSIMAFEARAGCKSTLSVEFDFPLGQHHGRLPGQWSCLRKLRQVRRQLWDFSGEAADARKARLAHLARVAQEALASVVEALAATLTRYARRGSATVPVTDIQGRFDEAKNVQRFIQMMRPAHRHRKFFEDFFKSTLCLEFLYEEIARDAERASRAL